MPTTHTSAYTRQAMSPREQSPGAPAQKRLEASLVEQIRTGKLAPGSRIKPLREVSQQYNITYRQAIGVVQRLQDKGYLRSIRGSGTYVCDVTSDRTVPTVALAIRTSGDVYGECTRHLLYKLHSRRVVPQVVGLDGYRLQDAKEHLDDVLEQLLQDNPTVLVLDASSFEEYVPDKVLAYERRGGRVIDIFGTGTTLRYSTQITPDFEAGIFEATRHMLVDHGYEDVALLTRRRRPTERFSDSVTRFYHRGFHRAIREFAPGARHRRLLVRDETSLDGRMDDILRMLKNGPPPRAIIAERDIMAHLAMKAAEQLGLRVPDDIAVCGTFDVPLAHTTDITSVSWDWEEMARHVAEEIDILVTASSQNRKTIHIRPHLVVRRSCGCGTVG